MQGRSAIVKAPIIIARVLANRRSTFMDLGKLCLRDVPVLIIRLRFLFSFSITPSFDGRVVDLSFL